jgi:hypothetical protein
MVKFAAAQDSAFKADKALAMQMSAFGRKADMTRRRILIGRSVLSLASSVEVTMTRLIFAAVAALAGVSFGPTAQAYEAPWCAVIERGTGSVYWDCQYHSFEDCYPRRSPAVVAQTEMSLMSVFGPLACRSGGNADSER